MYLYGMGVEENYEKAFYYYFNACTGGQPEQIEKQLI